MEVLPEKKFTDRVEQIVRIAGSAEKLAASAGVAARTIGKYKSGDSLPGMDALVSMSKAVGVRLEWLVEGTGPKWRDQGGMSADGSVGVVQVGHGSGNNHVQQSVTNSEGAADPQSVSLSTDLRELVELISKYGSPAIVAEFRRKLLKIKDITEG